MQQCHFDDYLLPAEKFAALKREQALPLAINPNSDQYLEERLQLLDEQLATVTRLAKDNELPDAILTESGLKITPLDAAVPIARRRRSLKPTSYFRASRSPNC